MGVSRQAVSKWENDAAIPQGFNRELLSQLLDLNFLKEESSAQRHSPNRLGQLGWVAAGILLILLLFSLFLRPQAEIPAELTQQTPPTIESITFYDGSQNKVQAEALWYDAAQIESILIQWDGGTPDNIKMFAIPSGAETTEMTELLLTKMIPDGDSAELLNADPLKQGFQNHIFFELDFGGTIVVSDQYNVFFDKALIPASDRCSESFQETLP